MQRSVSFTVNGLDGADPLRGRVPSEVNILRLRCWRCLLLAWRSTIMPQPRRRASDHHRRCRSYWHASAPAKCAARLGSRAMIGRIAATMGPCSAAEVFFGPRALCPTGSVRRFGQKATIDALRVIDAQHKIEHLCGQVRAYAVPVTTTPTWSPMNKIRERSAPALRGPRTRQNTGASPNRSGH